MTRGWRWALAVLLCGVGAVVAGPDPVATAAPPADVGVGRVVADLGTATKDTPAGFSHDGGYYAYLAPSGDRCDLRLLDVTHRTPVVLSHNHVVCDQGVLGWAADADTLVWKVNAAAGDVTTYAWDAGPGQVSVLAPDAHVFVPSRVSADGQFLAFTGRSDAHPAPSVDAPRYAWYVYDRAAGVSVPLSKADVHVEFRSWAPVGHNFTADVGGRTPYDSKTGGCFGSGTSCRVFPSEDSLYFGYQWSADGTAVAGGPAGQTEVFDFTDDSLTAFPAEAGFVDYALFLGGDADRLLGGLGPGLGGAVWDRESGRTTRIASANFPYASPTGQYLLYQDTAPQTYRYRNVSTGASALSTYRDTANHFVRGGAWMDDGKNYLGVGPGGCSSLRQWSPATNTVSLFGPPPARGCYSGPGDPDLGRISSASGRFTGASISYPYNQPSESYVVDLRRHVLLGPLVGGGSQWAPAGADLLIVSQYQTDGTLRLLLVDPTPSPDVDDKPRWSAATPTNGARVEAEVGEQVHVQLGASDLQGTPVNLSFRWRDTAGNPIASAPNGWSCDRKRLAAGATVADCTFAPKDHTATRFLDVSATNYTTGAQSDTRSYRVAVAR